MKLHTHAFSKKTRRIIVLALILTLLVGSASAGLLITSENGIVATGADGVTYNGASGIVATGADGLLTLTPNGVTAPLSDGIVATGADGLTFLGSNGIVATGADGMAITQASGIVATGADGLSIIDGNGATYQADSLFIHQANGIVATGADNLNVIGPSGIVATGADSRDITHADGVTATGLNGLSINGASGIVATGADGQTYTISPNGLTITGVSGIVATGADGLLFNGADGIVATGADGLLGLANLGHADGIVATGADQVGLKNASSLTAIGLNGFTLTGSDGRTYQAKSVFFTQPNGIVATGADGIVATGADGIVATGADALSIVNLNGLTATGLNGITIAGATGIVATGADGVVFPIVSNGLTISGASGIVATGADGVSLTGLTGVEFTGITAPLQRGLQSVDASLAALLNALTDDSNVNAAVVYYRAPTDADITNLRQLGVLLGERLHVLPVVPLTATKAQILRISRLPNVRAIYGNRTLSALGEPGNGLTGSTRVKTDPDLTARNGGRAVTGRGVTVAVLDTGLDGTHGDLAGRVKKNVKFVGALGLGINFNYPLTVEGLPNTDLLYGHGTFVGGVIAGGGARSNGKYTGVAPGAQLVGLGAGDLTLLSIVEGLDYLLWKGPELGVRVVNCSFSSDAFYDPLDPVNVATKMLTERGVSVVFSAGNSGPGADTLNPYAAAPWVISVGATDEQGRLADYSSRGSFVKGSGPTLVAPGTNVVSLRAGGVNLTGLLNLGLGGDLSKLSLFELPFYTVASGTSFSAPQVVGTIALMLEANPLLTPGQIKDILQRSATPMPPYYRHQVGAGMLNAHAAVLEAEFSARRMGAFRATLDRGQARFVNDPLTVFTGTVQPGSPYTANFTMPQNTLLASVQIGWGPLLSLNDLALKLIPPSGPARTEVNTLNLPILTGHQEGDLIDQPMGGTWRAQVRNSFGFLGTPQPFVGVAQTTHVEYTPLGDINGLTVTAQSEIYQVLRSFVMQPFGNRFRPQFKVSRFDLASALALGGRVPQYLAGAPQYADVTDDATRIVVESCQAAPVGSLFTDAAPGGTFRPDDRAARLTATVALVRAAGLRGEAESKAGVYLNVGDASSIPSSLRGYVWVALNRGLLASDGNRFRPNDAMTRAELAHAMATLANLATD
jgi:serine protease AprX